MNGALILSSSSSSSSSSSLRHTTRPWNRHSYGVESSSPNASFTHPTLREFLRDLEKGGSARLDFPSYASALRFCADVEALREGRAVHACIAREPRLARNTLLGNLLVSMYARCGAVEEARSAFDGIANHNCFSYNAMISAYAHSGRLDEAFSLFWDMLSRAETEPNSFVFVTMLSACLNLAIGKLIHALIVSKESKCNSKSKPESDSDIILKTALVSMYGKHGDPDQARCAFDRIRESDQASWNAMIVAYAQNGRSKEAFRLFYDMQMRRSPLAPNATSYVSLLHACTNSAKLAEGKLIHAHIVASGLAVNLALDNALLCMYGKCRALADARRLFARIAVRRNVVSWTTMITINTQNGCGKEALELLLEMVKTGIKPNGLTYASVLTACSELGALAEGKAIHAAIADSGKGARTNVVLATALVNMYSKCGSLGVARTLFDKMPKHDVVSWSAIIAAYGQNGQGEEALRLFAEMTEQGVKPNHVTFSSILSACSHSGLVDEGQRCFASMGREYGLAPNPDHYRCMLDLLGRAGKLDQAEDLINNRMPFRPGPKEWIALLSACGIHGDIDRGARAAQNVLKLDPKNDVAYVTLANMYALAGRWDDVARVRKEMRAM